LELVADRYLTSGTTAGIIGWKARKNGRHSRIREVAEAALVRFVGDPTERTYRHGDALEKQCALMRLGNLLRSIQRKHGDTAKPSQSKTALSAVRSRSCKVWDNAAMPNDDIRTSECNTPVEFKRVVGLV
jgi:hypothetical protein